MRDQYRHAPLRQLRKPQEHLVFGASIEGGGRLIENKDLRVTLIRARQRHLLPFAAGKLHAVIEAAAQHLVETLRYPLRDRIRETAARRFTDPRLVIQCLDLTHTDVFAQDEIVTDKILEDDSDVPAKTVEVIVTQLDTIEQDATFVGIVEAGEQLYERCLARPTLSHQSDALVRAGDERERCRRPPPWSPGPG